MGLALEGEPGAEAVDAEVLDLVVGLQEVMAIDACRLTPALIDAVHRVVAVDGLLLVVDLQIALPLVAVMIEHDVDGAVLFGGDAENGRMTGGSHLQRQMFLRQTHGIVVRMGNFLRGQKVN